MRGMNMTIDRNAGTQRAWRLAHGRTLPVGARALVMGILNVTPDSFSDGGRFTAHDAALRQAEAMAAAGADIVDIGGESTRPGAAAVSAMQEQGRVLPIVAALRERLDVALSIDTYRAETAQLAVRAGAHIVNDVWGLHRDPDIARIAAEEGAGLVIMHTGRDREKAPDVIADQRLFLDRSLEIAAAAGVNAAQIVLDPGFGFAKDTQENLELIRRFDELAAFPHPWLVGTSRKRFIGAVTGRDADHRALGTAATSVALRLKGAAIFRVHDVAENIEALKVADAIIASDAARQN